MMLKGITGGFIAVVLSGGTVPNAMASDAAPGENRLLNDRFVLSVGAFFSSIDTKASLGGGTDVDFEDDLGIPDSKTTVNVNLYWRVTDRFMLSGEYFTLNRSNRAVIDERIVWGDETYDVGASVKSKFDLDVIRANAGYSFIKDEKKQLAASLGVHWMRVDSKLSGSAFVNDVVVPLGSDGDDFGVPLPNIGLVGAYALTPKLTLAGSVDWFKAKVRGFKGKLWNVGASLDYRLFRYLGVGAGYNWFRLDVKDEEKEDGLDAKLTWHGPQLYLSASF
jgi:hypothetical protein